MSIPYIAVFSLIEGLWIGNLNLGGFIWLGYLILGLFILAAKKRVVYFPWKLWLPWYTLVALSLAWGSMLLRWNFQAFLQIFTPYVVGIIASFTITDEAQWNRFIRGFGRSLVLLVVIFLAFWYGPLKGFQEATLTGGMSGTFSLSPRPAAMTLAVIGCLFLANFHQIPRRAFLGWATCLTIAALTGSRMATFVLLAIWMLSPQQRRGWRQIFGAIFICILAVSLFYTPTFQRRFFYSGSGELSQIPKGDFADQGRFKFWTATLEEAQNHMIVGAGVGEADLFIAHEFVKVRQVHNDYLRILFELGLVGLSLFLFTVGFQVLGLLELERQARGTYNTAPAAAFLCIIAWLMFFVTDNSLIYGLPFTHPTFAIIGAAYGLGHFQNSDPNLLR